MINSSNPLVDIESELAEIKTSLYKRLESWHAIHDFATVDMEEFVTIIGTGGKWVRPLILILANGFCGGRFDARLREVGEALELIHAASLLYDDLQDNALTRRNTPAHHITYGTSATMSLCSLMGRLAMNIFTSSSELSREEKEFLLKVLFDLLIDMAAGQLEELTAVRDGLLDVDEKKYFRIIRGKTAALFRFACQAGAFLARPEAPELWSHLSQFGFLTGTLFQLVDDDQDIFGTKPSDKKRWQDIRESKRTLLFLFTRARLNADAKKTLDDLYLREKRTEAEVEQIVKWIKETNARVPLLSRIHEYHAAALAQLDEIGHLYSIEPAYAAVLRDQLNQFITD